MSTQLAESTKEASKDIGASVERLEKLFDKLYSDTFSMMKDTVSDMRKHMWPEEIKSEDQADKEAEKKADAKIVDLKKEINAEINKVLDRQSLADGKISNLREIVDKAIVVSRKVESDAHKETVRQHITQLLRRFSIRGKKLTADEILNFVARDFPSHSVLDELRKMKSDRVTLWDREDLGPNTVITLSRFQGNNIEP